LISWRDPKWPSSESAYDADDAINKTPSAELKYLHHMFPPVRSDCKMNQGELKIRVLQLYDAK
jgi:hypothetical protein